MRLHITTQVREVKNELLPQKKEYVLSELVDGLGRAWRAWEYSQTRGFNEEGSNSFSFIVLDVILDILEHLDSNSRVQVSSDSYDASSPPDLEPEVDNQDPALI